jgi:mono/diheme cytochrome c family protein
VFSNAQAEAGAALYKQHCIICHDKKYFRPVLKKLAGQSLDLLFDTMATTMPESNPGVLYDSEYVELIAYILKLSRAPAGEAPLGGDQHSLDAIIIAN